MADANVNNPNPMENKGHAPAEPRSAKLSEKIASVLGVSIQSEEAQIERMRSEARAVAEHWKSLGVDEKAAIVAKHVSNATEDSTRAA